MKEFARLVLGGLALAVFSSAIALAQPASRPATGHATAPASRPAVMAGPFQDMRQGQAELKEAIGSIDKLLDPATRAEFASKAAEPLRKIVAAGDKLPPVLSMSAGGDIPSAALTVNWLALSALVGDKDAQTELDRIAASDDPQEAIVGKVGQLLLRFWQAGGDDKAQLAVLDELEKLVNDNKESKTLPMVIGHFARTPASPPVAEKAKALEKILMDSRMAQIAKQQAAAQAKMRQAEGKPMVLEGDTIDGKKLTTADWKGKVILVDFWATWCGPCMAELPRVKALYAKYHDQGLEVLGVSCDRQEQALKDFLAKNGDMPWPQLFNQPGGWHPLATQYGVNGIPTMFLIDKKGICRSVTARGSMEELIPQMLEEKAE